MYDFVKHSTEWSNLHTVKTDMFKMTKTAMDYYTWVTLSFHTEDVVWVATWRITRRATHHKLKDAYERFH